MLTNDLTPSFDSLIYGVMICEKYIRLTIQPKFQKLFKERTVDNNITKYVKCVYLLLSSYESHLTCIQKKTMF